MNRTRNLKQKLTQVNRLWQEEEYDRAFRLVEELLHESPSDARLYILWANLVQLQEKPAHDLAEVEEALKAAMDLDPDSPAAAIELGHFLDSVEDDPQAASRAFAEGTSRARRLLMDGLLGQAKAFLQLDKNEEANRCLMELLYLSNAGSSAHRDKRARAGMARKIESLVRDVFASQPA